MTHGYGNLKSAESVTDWNSNSTTYSYDDAGRMTSTTLPSGTGIVSSYVDGLGSTMAIVDSSGNSQKSYTYDVYGEATPSGGLSNEFDFAGQQTDATGLQYLRARYYDPETGVFLSRDPLASRPTWFGNGFSYGNSNPANLADPTGLCSFYSALSCGDDIWNAVSSAFRDTVDAARAAGSAIAAGAGWTADRIVAISSPKKSRTRGDRVRMSSALTTT